MLPTLHVGIGERYVWAEEKFSETGGGFFDFGGGGTAGHAVHLFRPVLDVDAKVYSHL